MRNSERTRRRSETGRRFASASTIPLQDCEWSTTLPEPLQPDWPESMSLLVQTLQPKRRLEQHREASKAKFREWKLYCRSSSHFATVQDRRQNIWNFHRHAGAAQNREHPI